MLLFQHPKVTISQRKSTEAVNIFWFGQGSTLNFQIIFSLTYNTNASPIFLLLKHVL